MGAALNPKFTRAYEYSDAWVEDSRLVVLNARDAEAKGAQIMVGTKVLAATRADGLWHVTTESAAGRATFHRAGFGERRRALGRRCHS